MFLCSVFVTLSMSLLGFMMGTMLANFYMCDIILVLRAVLNMIVRNASPSGFRCLLISFSGPCELLFLLCVIASCGEYNVISLYFMGSRLMNLFDLCV